MARLKIIPTCHKCSDHTPLVERKRKNSVAWECPKHGTIMEAPWHNPEDEIGAH